KTPCRAMSTLISLAPLAAGPCSKSLVLTGGCSSPLLREASWRSDYFSFTCRACAARTFCSLSPFSLARQRSLPLTRRWWRLRPLLLALSLSGALGADETPAPLTFRRVYVPAEALDSQIRGLLPMKRSEFERRIARTQEPGRTIAGQTSARIEEATFRAKLDG